MLEIEMAELEKLDNRVTRMKATLQRRMVRWFEEPTEQNCNAMGRTGRRLRGLALRTSAMAKECRRKLEVLRRCN